MSVVAVGSVRSAGATTAALALAATWPPGSRVLLAELDPAGGTVAAASGWPPEPSTVSLAAAARRGGDPELIWEHCHLLPGGAEVLAAPASAEQSQAALGLLDGLLARLGELDAAVFADCGRLDPGSPSRVLLDRADLAVLVTRPRLADLHALASWLEARPLEAHRPALITVGDGPYPDAEIAEALGTQVLARFPWGPEAAADLVAVPASARSVRLAPLVRAARSLADRLASGGMAGPEPAAIHEEAVFAGARAKVATRMWRAWRTAPETVPTNGSTRNGSAP